MFFTNDSLFLNFGRLALPNEAENNLANSVYEGFRYGQLGTAIYEFRQT